MKTKAIQNEKGQPGNAVWRAVANPLEGNGDHMSMPTLPFTCFDMMKNSARRSDSLAKCASTGFTPVSNKSCGAFFSSSF